MHNYPKGMSVVPTGNITVARLYNTNIVTINHSDNIITLNSGGWKTKHTKKCSNLILSRYDMHLYQKDFTWYVVDQDNKTIEYTDNMEIGYKQAV